MTCSSSLLLSALAVALLLLLVSRQAEAFGVVPPPTTAASTGLGMFKGLSGAFANDESLGKPKNEGLKNGPDYNEQVTVNGKPVPGAVVGQKLTVVAGRVRVKIPVNCQQGDCGTCMVKLNGRKVKACQTLLPKGKATIQTL